jgi:hypothetical protein
MARSWAAHVPPKNGHDEEIVALETWPDTATEVFFVPSQMNVTSLVPPNVPPSGPIMVKLLLEVPTIQLLMGACAQPLTGSHESVVQALPSSQLIAAWVQALAVHPSVVQTSLSSHPTGTMGVYTQPTEGAHESLVQMSLSLQTIGVCEQEQLSV